MLGCETRQVGYCARCQGYTVQASLTMIGMETQSSPSFTKDLTRSGLVIATAVFGAAESWLARRSRRLRHPLEPRTPAAAPPCPPPAASTAGAGSSADASCRAGECGC